MSNKTRDEKRAEFKDISERFHKAFFELEDNNGSITNKDYLGIIIIELKQIKHLLRR